MHRRHFLPLVASGAAVLACPALAQSPAPTVFAAASLTDAMRALASAWQTAGHPAPRLSFAASSALARQIEQGAPADIFASADEPWMDYVEQRGLILPASRTSPLGNSLVLIAPPGSKAAPVPPGSKAAPVPLGRETDLLAMAGDGRIATGDPAHVPVGKYAEAALRWMGQWDKAAPRLARADNVRAALLLVERGEAPLGIVYGTDAAAIPGLRLLGRFPAESHPPITYPFALTRRAGGHAEARAFFDFITGPDAAETYRRLGFTLRAA